MTVNQVSVFIENRQGRLGEVLQVLKDNDVNILSISLADTTEYGLLRLIVNKPEVAKDIVPIHSRTGNKISFTIKHHLKLARLERVTPDK